MVATALVLFARPFLRRTPHYRLSAVFCAVNGFFGVLPPCQFARNLLFLLVVPAEGFEPPTYGLQNRCTTTVLSRLGN
jgi:hypothetical protein